MTLIHPLSVVSPHAKLGPGVSVGPFCVVEDDVVIGEGSSLAAGTIVKRGTVLGARNRVHEKSVLGGLPQHLHMPATAGNLVIGADNTIREHVTMHRALREGDSTRIGDNNFIMVGAHVAHDCVVGSHVIIANGVQLGGHVEVHDHAYVGGCSAVHQFCRIGKYAMIGGLARVIKDIPPFVTVDGKSGYIVGLNTIGLKRKGFTPQSLMELKRAYRQIYRTGLTWNDVVSSLLEQFGDSPASEFSTFFAGGKRGFTPERRVPPNATIKLHGTSQRLPDSAAKAG